MDGGGRRSNRRLRDKNGWHASESIRFILNDTEIALSDVARTATLLDFLRLERPLTGTRKAARGRLRRLYCSSARLSGRGGDENLVYEASTPASASQDR